MAVLPGFQHAGKAVCPGGHTQVFGLWHLLPKAAPHAGGALWWWQSDGEVEGVEPPARPAAAQGC